MSEERLRFDDRVAIVTGAGNGLGRAYALALAERGATVVVNDIGTSPDGYGESDRAARLVVDEIVAAGGDAVPDFHSVAGEESASAIVQDAIERFGRVDVLVNNAGVMIPAFLHEMTSADILKLVDVHLLGTIWLCRSVWPHMVERGYGRIVNVTSTPTRKFPVYGAVKYGIQGLTEALALADPEAGIAVNAVSPAAGTRAVDHLVVDSEYKTAMLEEMSPEQVAAVVTVLSHERCPVNGKTVSTGGGGVGMRQQAITGDYFNPSITAEDLLERWESVTVDYQGEWMGRWRRGGGFENVEYTAGGTNYSGSAR